MCRISTHDYKNGCYLTPGGTAGLTPKGTCFMLLREARGMLERRWQVGGGGDKCRVLGIQLIRQQRTRSGLSPELLVTKQLLFVALMFTS